MTKPWHVFRVCSLVTLTSLSPFFSTANAQDDRGQSIRVGETQVTPALGLDFVTVDNIYRTLNDPESANGLVVSPSVSWNADRRLLELRASYSGSYGAFSESILDYVDHQLTLAANASPAKRHRGSVAFNYSRSHEPIGTGQTALDSNQSDQVVSNDVSLVTRYTYGNRTAKGNLGGGLRLSTQTFNDVGTITQGDDNSVLRPFAFFSYRVSPDTRLRAEIEYTVFDYDEDRRDRVETAFLVGLDLAPAARTGGRIRVGVSNANFETAGISDRSQFIADINFYYRVREYSRFNLVFNRKLETVDEDATGAGESIVDNASLSWNHDWSSLVSSTTRIGLSVVDRECPNIDTATSDLGFSLKTNIRRWLTLGAGVNYVKRNADLCDTTQASDASDYDLTSFRVFLRTTL